MAFAKQNVARAINFARASGSKSVTQSMGGVGLIQADLTIENARCFPSFSVGNRSPRDCIMLFRDRLASFSSEPSVATGKTETSHVMSLQPATLSHRSEFRRVVGLISVRANKFCKPVQLVFVPFRLLV